MKWNRATALAREWYTSGASCTKTMPIIQTIDVKPVSFKLKNPFVTAGGRKTETHNVQITLHLADGTLGMSEASSSIAMPNESQENMVRALKSMIPELRGKPIENYRELVATSW